MKVFITGANGLLATNTIIELLNRGYHVRGLIRNAKKFTYFKHPDLELVEGDINDYKITNNALQDCDYVIHAAGLTIQKSIKYSDYHKINVKGTENVLNASPENKIKKLVYVSTANTIGFGTGSDMGNEKMNIKEPFSKSHYVISKLEGQKIVLSAPKKIEVVVVNPTFMIGAYDSKPSSGRIILMGLNKYILFYPPGGKNFVHVQDAAKGVVAALEKGKNGESYLLAGENLSYKEFFQMLNERINKNPVMIKVPGFILLSFGLLGSLFRKTGIKTNLSTIHMRILCLKNYYSNKKSMDELGLTYQPVKEAIDDAVTWFIKHGMIGKSF
jgi:dihydroflavonol-4-reductase